MVITIVPEFALARSGAYACYAQQEGLLQYAWNNGRAHTHSTIAHRHHSKRYWHYASRWRILELGNLAHLHLAAKFGIYCRDGCEHILIAQHHRHIAINLHFSLFASTYFARKLIWKINNAKHLALSHQAAGILHIGGIVSHAHLLGCIEHTGILPRHRCATLINYRHWHILHNFAIIDQRI